MRKSTEMLNLFLKMSIVFMMMLVVFIDSDILNSVLLEETEDLIVESTTNPTTVVSKSKTQLMGQVVDDNEENDTQLSGQVVVNDKEISNSYVTTLSVNEANNWVWPTESNYKITSYYGYRWGKLHGAIDINGPGYGSKIYAANNGTVVTVKGGCVAGNASCNGAGGNYIVIKHNSNNYYTLYMHLKDIKVRVGDVVSRGQTIGTMGNTGNVVPAPTSSNPYAGTHLHFALYIGEPYRGGYAVDPMRLY